MGLWGGLDAQRVESVQSGTYGTTITMSTTANTWSAYTQLTASTAHAYHWLNVTLGRANSSSSPFTMAVEIAQGAASSEIELGTFFIACPATYKVGRTFALPVSVPAGTRLSARARCNKGPFTGPKIDVGVWGVHGGFGQIPHLGSKVTSNGTTISTTSGTTIDPGGTANTKGSWVQIVGSTAQETYWVILNSLFENSVASNCTWAVDIGVGGSGSEIVWYPDLLFEGSLSSDQMVPFLYGFPLTISRAQRIAVRAACSITDATDRLFDVQLITVS